MIKRVVFRPIGWVWNQVAGPRYHDWQDVISEIVLDEDLASALDGIEEFSHIVVLFYISKVTGKQRAVRHIRPQNRADMPEVGIFATRTQYRPNPIGVTTVRLLERKGNVLRVAGLDAYNGTPVLDIKPYAPDAALAGEARIPAWLQRLHAHSGETTGETENSETAEEQSEHPIESENSHD